MNKIEFNNLTKEDIAEEKLLEEILLYAMEKEEMTNTNFDIIFVGNDYIHNLNRTYRNIDRPTDVITFALEDEDKMVNGSDIRILGDIFISVDKAHEQAIEYGHSFQREICFLAVHGFYHLLGYDHMTKEDETTMFTKQEEILSHFNIKKDKQYESNTKQ